MFIFWIPFYYEIKLLLLLALQFPQLKLASTLYTSYIRPFLKKNEKKIDASIGEVASAARKKGSDFLSEKGPQLMNSVVSGMTTLQQQAKEQ